MEGCPDKKTPTVRITSCVTQMMQCTVHFFAVYLHLPENYYSHFLKKQFMQHTCTYLICRKLLKICRSSLLDTLKIQNKMS